VRPRGRSEGIARSRRRRGVGESEHDPPRPGFAFRVDNIKSAPIRRFSRRSRGWGTHRLVAGDGGLELLGGLEHLDHLERGVWVCGGGWVCDARRCVRRPRDASRARSPSRRRDSRSTLSVRFLRLLESTNRQPGDPDAPSIASRRPSGETLRLARARLGSRAPPPRAAPPRLERCLSTCSARRAWPPRRWRWRRPACSPPRWSTTTPPWPRTRSTS